MISRHPTALTPPDSEVAPEEFADDAESKNVVPFTPKPGQTAGAAAEIQQEIRQKESLPQEEPSVLDAATYEHWQPIGNQIRRLNEFA